MKKYYPKIKPNMLRANVLPDTQWGGDRYIFTFDETTGDTYYADTSRVYKSNKLFRDGDRELVLTLSSQVLHVERMANDKILVIHYNGAGIVDDSNGTWNYTETKSGQWGRYSLPFPTMKNVDVFNNIVLVSCYGTKVADADFKAWISRDYGETYEEIFSTREQSPDPNDAHIHGIAFDKFRNYIWMIVGDHTSAQLLYSDTWGKSWKNVETRPGILPMFTEIVVLPDSILLGTDAGPDGILKLPFRDNRLQPTPDVENLEITLLRSEANDINMYGFFLRGVADVDVYPHKIVSSFPGHSPFGDFWQVLYTYNGTDIYQILGNQIHDGVVSTTNVAGDIKVQHLCSITPSDYTIDGKPAGNIAIGRGSIFDGESWKLAVIEIDLPEWILVE